MKELYANVTSPVELSFTMELRYKYCFMVSLTKAENSHSQGNYFL